MINTSRKDSTGLYNCSKSYKDAYKLYTANFKFKSAASESFGGSNPKRLMLTQKQYKDIWFDISDAIFKEILENSANLKLPFGLGEQLRIKKKKMSLSFLKKNDNLKYDYGHYLKTGNKKFHLNEHTDYHRYGFYWFCRKGPKNRTLYKFVPLRIRKRELANQIKNHNRDYFL